MMIDEATITFTGGHGGTGIVSFGKMTGSGPDGGNGGRGGDIFVEAASDLTLLAQFLTQTEFEAENGIPGGKKKATGRDGKDLTILLPVGTTLTEIETVREPGLVTSGETIDLVEVGQRVMISKGGRGGRGNFEFRSPRRTTPKFAQNGLPGEKRLFHINLKLIADFGFVGLPNAGK
nr:GTPase ObgE [Candidatus Woesebacteria bacterium]